ncbi:hypothetical protein J0X19_22825 [Hymenobacter sp. BT186]|uniref:Prepilin type IV endopeptidase peptidase domain-containing protein n=1 Tax=Hymenobacter telluris TaxID=2816474 RepID=A0A939F132_9BACT|nr:hypothetical protein [Hymenobacter telluris]MBO0360812.1 hypothetical protein [Hymenobacter telluris]MBW3376841.1 hypothetical protein [Hymenobacter norwichensis]
MTTFTIIHYSAEVLAFSMLISMLVQDWRWRGVYWYFFPLLAVLFFGLRLDQQPLETVLADSAVNVAFVVLQMLVLSLYVRLRFAASLQAYLGLGDILYWLAVAVFFSPVVFILYYLSSLVVALLTFLIVRRVVSKPIDARIPLAGLQAGYLALLLLVSWLSPTKLPVGDQWLLDYIS